MSANFAGSLRRLIMLTAAALSLTAAAATLPNTDLVPLSGNVHRFARAQFDAGEAPSTLRPKGLDIVFTKTPEQEQALKQLLAAQQDPKSPQYHKWLTPAQYGQRFGASDATLAAVTNWLKSSGFSVGQVPAGRGHLPFFGNKMQVEGALHTQIHLFAIANEQHYANVSAPSVPAALASAIAAIRGLNDFHPRPGVHPPKAGPRGALPLVGQANARSFDAPDTFYSGSNQWPGYVGPTDFAIMYNLQPAYSQGFTGAGVTIAIAAQSDVDPSVLATFWSAFGVSGPSFGLPAQQFTSVAVSASSDPGQTNDGNEDEAYLDTEILGALAPGAHLILVRDQDAGNAAWYAIDQNLGAILNISFGQCESAQASNNAVVESMYQQAVTEGITITVSSDDAGVVGCVAQSDLGTTNDVNSNGFAVNGLASTPYNLAVGGTDFNDLTTSGQYWSTVNQSRTLASALSHIPEMVWNDSCANPVFAAAYGAPDTITFCNTAMIQNQSNPFIDISGGGSGVSNCTTTNTNGDCTGGYAQPSWQQGVLGITNFGGRAIPDVSLIATLWLMCSYDTTPCDPTQAPTFQSGTGTIKVLEGTSAAAPSMAAIVALIDQAQISSSVPDGRQGLLNPTLYSLAAIEYGSATTAAACDASQGVITNPACVFYDVTAGSSAQPCKVSSYTSNPTIESFSSTCGTESGDKTGIMEINGVQSYAAGAGFDVASGLGSINASALIASFVSSPAPSGLRASLSGQTATLTWTADSSAASYNVYQGTAPGSVSSSAVQANITGTSTTVSGLQFGQQYVFALAAVSSSGVISPRSNSVDVTTVPAAPSAVSVAAPGTTAGSLNLGWNASTGATSYSLFQGTTSGGEGTTAVQSGLSGTTTSLTNLTPGKQYFFTVVAVDAGGSSAPSPEATGTTIASPPTGFAAGAGNASVSLTWAASSGATSYNVYEGTTSGGEVATPVQTGVTGTSVTLSGLTNGKKYYFTLAAVDPGGVSTQSSEASATPAAPKGGGGSTDWLVLAGLAALLGTRARRLT